MRDEAAARGIPSLAALARLDRAEIFLRLGAHDEACPRARDAADACAALDLRYESAKAGLFGALAQFRIGQLAGAKRGVERALAAFDAEGNRVWTGEGLLGLATLWWKDGNPRAAAALLSAARRRFVDAGDRERAACAATLHARALLACGDVRAARRAFASVRRARRTTPRLAHLKLAAGAARARPATWPGRGACSRARPRRPSGWRRASSTNSGVRRSGANGAGRTANWRRSNCPRAASPRRSRRSRRARPRAARRDRAAPGARRPAESVRRWAASAQARERARRAGTSVTSREGEAQLERSSRMLAARPARVIRAAELCRALPERAALLDYFVHDGALGALALARDGVTGRGARASEAQVAPRMHALLFALRGAAYLPAEARQVDDALRAPLAELAALALWPLLAGRERPGALAIAPAGALARLPWEALPLPDGRALCEAAESVVVPGLRLALAREDQPAAPTARPLVVAVDAGELDAVARETAAVVAAFPDAEVLAGADATAERFLALAPSAPWIHFAGHGGWRADAPLESGLRLADRWLLAGELAESPLAARWVTLSACHTARALVRPGEEWFGLSRSFLLAGARAVVAAQWDVDDAATAALMADLYARLGQSTPIARALAQTQRQLHRHGVHPLDWAGFVVLGGPGLLTPGDDRASGHEV
ncbi:MAG: CHAT domain-containing protein [Candidatus Eisenbacteria bacterium]